MARGRKPGKRTNKVVKISLPKKIYYILYGIAGNNEQKLNKLIKTIIEEKLDNSTMADLTKLLENAKKEKEEVEE
ncbi:hypothetical protein [Desulfurobacterium atlanticum]|uniref:Uncharacterized protein n=1 Tax=Desulfurobacterium atlanticum TaxID=240169 RepID=A0A238Y6W5_9BACT|nr:hypothetical protein [Desulfurobacterium atlanticum]SNR66760.1 hypothetical protein SAMN06265340_102163 [Desulfurobacterium atlanticum]